MAKSTKPAVICSHPKLAQGGFSLIEVAIALMVIGVLILPALTMYAISVEAQKMAQNKVSVATASTALTKYVLLHGRYPTPAVPSDLIGSATFGRPAVRPVGGWLDCQAAGLPAGSICETTLNTQALRGVLIGVLPFAELGIPYTSVLDSNKNLLTYAVTTNLTATGTYAEDGGGIIVRVLTSATDDTPIDLYVGTEPRSHFVVVGHGDDARGAFGQGGTRGQACGTAANSTDFENCNNDGTFRSNLIAGTSDVQRFLAAGAAHFDDYVLERNSSAEGMWSYTRDATASLSMEDRVGGNVAIGDCDGRAPCVPLSRLDVYGIGTGDTPAARMATLKTRRICGRGLPGGDGLGGGTFSCVSNYDGASNLLGADQSVCVEGVCPPVGTGWNATNLPPWFTPDLIAATPPVLPESGDYWMTTPEHGNFHRGNGIRCVGNRALNGIFDRDESCNDASAVSPATKARIQSCTNPGEYARGIDTAGRLICQLPADNT